MSLRQLFSVRSMLPENIARQGIPSSRSMYSEYIRIALPSVLEMVLISLINMADTVMVSTIGTDAVAAVGLVNQPRFLVLCAFFAINTGLTTVVAHRKGEERRADANTVLRNTLLLVFLLALVMMAIFLPLAEPLMRFAGAEEGRTLEDATLYFVIINTVLPLNTLSLAICAAQRGAGNTRLTMYVNITSNLINILFNWLLINGIGPFPKLGVKGAAIATAIGLVCGFLLSLFSVLHTRRTDSFLLLTKHDSWKVDRKSLGDVLKISRSSLVEQVAIRIGFFSYSMIVASLGTDAFAANQIASQFLSISYNAADGLGIAGTALVGQKLGERRKDLAYIYGTLARRFSLVVAILLAAFCVVCRGPLVSLFISENASPGVQELSELLMIIVGIFQPFQMIATVAAGALRGAGDVKYTARVMMLAVMLIRPLLAIACVWLIGTCMGLTDLALIGAWIAGVTDVLIRMILFVRRYTGGKWQDIQV